jgi:hypothetical protein
LAAGIKIHGFIYGIPVALMVLASAKNAHERIIIAIIGCACALASALLPYLAKGASIVGYWHFLNVVLHHGWSASLFFQNLPFALVLMMPIIGISMCRKPVVDPVQYSLLVGLYMSVVIMTVIGANPGAGDYYLLPIIPFWIYGITGVLKSYDVRTNEIAAAVFICLGLAYGPRVFLYMRGLQGAYEAAAQSEPNKIAELVTFVESYPEAQFGISDDEHYSSYFYRVLSVFAGRALQVDFGVWMELEHAGVDEKYILRFIQDCNVPIWILPIGTPFATANNYNQLPLLTEEFRHTFSRNYQLIKIGQAYQVWECKSRQ